jgi:RNA polymerase sigma-70 factor, ECF subfamily
MYAIVKYKLWDYLRYRKKVYDKEISDDGSLLGKIEGKSTEENPLLEEELSIAIDKLSPKEKKIISLLKLEGYKVKEIALQLKMSETSVKVAAHRGYVKLRKLLKSYTYLCVTIFVLYDNIFMEIV